MAATRVLSALYLLLSFLGAAMGEQVITTEENSVVEVVNSVNPPPVIPASDISGPLARSSFYCTINGEVLNPGESYDYDAGSTGIYICTCIDQVGVDCVYQEGSHTCTVSGVEFAAGTHILTDSGGWTSVCSCPDVIDPNESIYTISCVTPTGGHRCTVGGVGYYPGESWTAAVGGVDYACECPSTASPENPNYVEWGCRYSSEGNTCVFDDVPYDVDTDYVISGYLGWMVSCTCGVAGSCSLVTKKHTCFFYDDGLFHKPKAAAVVDVDGVTSRCSCPLRSSNAIGDPVYMGCNPLPAECLEPKDTGDCGDSLDRYYFKLSVGQCRRFTFTGCGGNNNNFLTKSACKSTCQV